MANPLLARAAPEYLASRNQIIEIIEHISIFERLAAIVEEDLAALPENGRPADWRKTEVKVDLRFGWADARRRLPQLTGQVQTAVPAVCQRCLELCRLPLELDLRVLLLNDAAAGPGGDEALEIWELEEATVRPIDIVEEFLVMALPMAAMHGDHENCGALAAAADEELTDTVRPFADLKARIDESR